MPRTSENRAFGFRAEGIVRILTTANPNEVLTALLLIGIDPRMPDAFDVLLEIAVDIIATPFVDLIKFFDTAVKAVDALTEIADTLNTRHHGVVAGESSVQRAGRIARNNVLVTQEEIERLQKQFQERMKNAKLQFPPIVLPASPGIFEQA